jgi:peptide/nickel transport system substrate-binding protein
MSELLNAGAVGSGVRATPRRMRRVPLVIAVAVAAVAGTVTGVLATSDHASTLHRLAENSVGVLDTNNGHLVAEIGVDLSPTSAAAGSNAVWTANTGANTVTRIDTATRRTTNTISVGQAPSAIVVAFDSVWVTNAGSGTVSRIDPVAYSIQTITVGTSPGGIAAGAGAIWVTNTADDTVSRINPAQNAVTATIGVGNSPDGVAVGDSVWVANATSNTVSEIDPRSASVTQTIHVGNDPRDVAVAGADVWVTNNSDGTVTRIDASTANVAGTVPVGPEPTSLAVVGSRLWVAIQGAGSLVELDATSSRVVRTVPVGATPTGVVPAAGRLWVTTSIDPALHVGGAITVAGQDPGSIDPDYFGQPWTLWLINDSYDALVGFRHANGAEGTELVPDLATAIPDPTNGGRTYTFRLRSGIRWSTGAVVTVSDVQRGLERILASGLPGLPQEIVGGSLCTQRACAISGIVADPADATVTITLNAPSGDFLDLLAFAVATPTATPLGDQGSKPIPATGPYAITHDDGKQVVLTRNPYFRVWSATAQPAGYPDSISWHIDPNGDDTKAAADAVAQGTADWADARGAAALAQLQARFGGRLFLTPTETAHGVALNTTLPPFNDVRVRRALAYAVDRQAVADAWFTPATPTCQLLPPNFPGYRPYCPYTLRPSASGAWSAPDFPTAQRLVDESRTNGMAVSVYASPAVAAGMRPVVDALNQLGYRAKLVVYTKDDYFSFVADSRNKVQASFGGWVAGAPNPEDFLVPQFECSAFAPASANNQNSSAFCDPALDRLTAKAQEEQATSAAAAGPIWAQLDHELIDQAPWIGLVTPSWVDVVSTRVHNYTRSSVLGVFFDQMWVR